MACSFCREVTTPRPPNNAPVIGYMANHLDMSGECGPVDISQRIYWMEMIPDWNHEFFQVFPIWLLSVVFSHLTKRQENPGFYPHPLPLGVHYQLTVSGSFQLQLYISPILALWRNMGNDISSYVFVVPPIIKFDASPQAFSPLYFSFEECVECESPIILWQYCWWKKSG